MQLIDPPFLVNGLMSNQVQNLIYHESRDWNALVVGRAGLDLYPQPSGSKTMSAELFASDVGGSGANIAIAMKRAGGNIGLISALSNDPVGLFVSEDGTIYVADYQNHRSACMRGKPEGKYFFVNFWIVGLILCACIGKP